jgi:hypothetical protein
MKYPKARSSLSLGFLVFFAVIAGYFAWCSWRVNTGRLMAEATSADGRYILRFRTFPMTDAGRYALGAWDRDLLQCELWDASHPEEPISSCRFHSDSYRAYSASASWCEARCGHITIGRNYDIHCLVEGGKVTWQTWANSFVVVDGELEEWGEEFRCKALSP